MSGPNLGWGDDGIRRSPLPPAAREPADVSPSPRRSLLGHPRGVTFRSQTRAPLRLLQNLPDNPLPNHRPGLRRQFQTLPSGEAAAREVRRAGPQVRTAPKPGQNSPASPGPGGVPRASRGRGRRRPGTRQRGGAAPRRRPWRAARRGHGRARRDRENRARPGPTWAAREDPAQLPRRLLRPRPFRVPRRPRAYGPRRPLRGESLAARPVAGDATEHSGVRACEVL